MTVSKTGKSSSKLTNQSSFKYSNGDIQVKRRFPNNILYKMSETGDFIETKKVYPNYFHDSKTQDLIGWRYWEKS